MAKSATAKTGGNGICCGNGVTMVEGIIAIKSLRPMPVEDLKILAKDLKGIGVIDKHASIGFGGALTNDVKAALAGQKIQVESFVAGLGGRDINKEKIKDAIETIMKGKRGKWLK